MSAIGLRASRGRVLRPVKRTREANLPGGGGGGFGRGGGPGGGPGGFGIDICKFR